MNTPEEFPRDPAILMEMLKGPDALNRQRAADALGMIYEVTEAIILSLAEALFDPQDEVCQNAAVSLFIRGSKAKPAIPLLVKALQHRDSRVRCLAMSTLASIGADAKHALPHIMEQLDSPDPRIRYWSAAAAAKLTGNAAEKKENRNTFQFRRRTKEK